MLLIAHELSLTGAPRVALEIFRALGNAVELRTISATGGGLEEPFRELGPVYILSRVPGRHVRSLHASASILAKGFGRLRAPFVGGRVRVWRPDVACVNSAAALGLVRRLALGDVPVLLYVHELGTAIARLTAEHRKLLRDLPDRYVAVSSAAAGELASYGVDDDMVSVIPPPVDVARVEDMAGFGTEKGGTPPTTGFLVGGAGNPHWTKGIESWLHMARALVDRLGTDVVRFEWVGVRSNDVGVEFAAMVRKLRLDSSVELTTETTNPYVRYRRFDVFAMTSWEEAASLVVLENMALGIPVVCFRGSGGPAEEVGDAGVVIDDFSLSRMADAVAELIENADLRTSLAARARTRVATVNAPGRVAQLMSDELATAAGRGPVADSHGTVGR